MSKCKLCEKEISWEHHLYPLPYIVYNNDLIERFCPDCWNRIWAEWYEYEGDTEFTNLTYGYPTDEYIISKYKGNDLVGKIGRDTIVEEPKKKPGDWCRSILPKESPLKTVWGKKKHWWNRCNREK